MSKVNTVKGYDATKQEPTTALVYGCPIPAYHFTMSGTTSFSGSLSPDVLYMFQAPDTDVFFKLHESGTSPGALYTKIQARTDFPFVAPQGLFTQPWVTVSGSTTTAGVLILNKMFR